MMVMMMMMTTMKQAKNVGKKLLKM